MDNNLNIRNVRKKDLMEVSKIAIEGWKTAYRGILDDAYLDIACFESQQAIEFLIKSILQENAVVFDKTHDIRYLLELLKSCNFTFVFVVEINFSALAPNFDRDVFFLFAVIKSFSFVFDRNFFLAERRPC